MISIFHRNILIRAALTAIVTTIVYFVNPFGFRTATVKYSEDIVIRLLSPWYGNRGESEITIILLDDYFIGRTEKRYPVSYHQLIRLFRTIKQHQPSTVFFDIIQQYEHSSGFEQWLKILNQAKFPVFMAGLPSGGTPEAGASSNPLQNQLKQVTELTAVGWKGYDYAHYYPLLVKNPHPSRSDLPSESYLSTAALDLYKVWCRTNQTQCTLGPAELDNPSLFSQPMVVKWSNRAAPGQSGDLYLPEPCPENPDGKFSQLINWVRLEFGRWLPDFFKNLEKQRQSCFHIRTLSATSLIEPGSMDPESRINGALKDKIVLVGYSLQSNSDIIDSPLHGQLAGVFYHAMALDNLINFGKKYWHIPPSLIGTISISDIWEGLFQGVAVGWACYFRMWYLSLAFWREEELTPEIQKEEKRFLRNIKVLSGVSLILLIISLMLCFYWKLGVTNLFTLFMTTGLFGYAVFEKFVVQKIQFLRTTN